MDREIAPEVRQRRIVRRVVVALIALAAVTFIGAATVELLRPSLDRSRVQFAVVRRGPVWMAVRKTKSVDRANDFRYDFGLVAFKAPRGSPVLP